MRLTCNLLRKLVCLAAGMMLLISPLHGNASDLQGAHIIDAPFVLKAPQSAVVGVMEGLLSDRTLYDALMACNIPAQEILSLAKSFKSVFDFRHARPKDYYRVCVDNRNMIQKFVYKTSPLDEYEAVKDGNGDYSVHKREIILDRRVVAKVFTIDSSLCQAVADAGENQQIASLISDVFAWDIDFYLYPRKGDRIAVVYERCYKDGSFVKFGDILAARYVGKYSTFSAFWFNDGPVAGYYDETGQPLKKMFLRTPLKFGRMTSSYSIRRFHPISKRYRAHTGIDYGAPTGTAIMATASGTVVFAGHKSGYGKTIIIKHANGYQTYYGHCSKLLKKKGQVVEQGQIIARVGQTGVATGPHVHYEVRVNGNPINPDSVMKSRGNVLNAETLATFKKTVDNRLLMVNGLLTDENHPLLIARDNEVP